MTARDRVEVTEGDGSGEPDYVLSVYHYHSVLLRINVIKSNGDESAPAAVYESTALLTIPPATGMCIVHGAFSFVVDTLIHYTESRVTMLVNDVYVEDADLWVGEHEPSLARRGWAKLKGVSK